MGDDNLYENNTKKKKVKQNQIKKKWWIIWTQKVIQWSNIIKNQQEKKII